MKIYTCSEARERLRPCWRRPAGVASSRSECFLANVPAGSRVIEASVEGEVLFRRTILGRSGVATDTRLDADTAPTAPDSDFAAFQPSGARRYEVSLIHTISDSCVDIPSVGISAQLGDGEPWRSDWLPPGEYATTIAVYNTVFETGTGVRPDSPTQVFVGPPDEGPKRVVLGLGSLHNWLSSSFLGDSLYRAWDVLPFDEPPEVVDRVVPSYPPNARVEEEEAVVLLKVAIDETGRLVGVAPFSGSGGFAESAVHSVVRSRYTPAKLMGQVVPATYMRRCVRSKG